MAFAIRAAQRDDLAGIAQLAADAQVDLNRYCAYFGDDAASIAADVAEVIGPDPVPGADWTAATWVACDGPRLIGWLLAETDPDMGRVWWWGPVIARDKLPRATDLTDALYQAASQAVARYSEHEMAFDEASSLLGSFAIRQGLQPDAGSVVLRTAPFAERSWDTSPGIMSICDRHHTAVQILHDSLFAGTHTSGQKLISEDVGSTVLVAVTGSAGEEVAGYIATEQQSDGSLYLDYLGVAEHCRRQGVAKRLVSEALHRAAGQGASHAHLTVRADNVAARRTYESLGFIEERVVTPFRRGFTLG